MDFFSNTFFLLKNVNQGCLQSADWCERPRSRIRETQSMNDRTWRLVTKAARLQFQNGVLKGANDP
jgi:hypothetical protein